MTDWDALLKFRSHHELRPPCPADRISREEARLGPFPAQVARMLLTFNGGGLFIAAIELVTLFGLSGPEDDPAGDWFIDRYTPAWRRTAMAGRGELAIGMFNYGGLVVIGADAVVREWDSAQGCWSSEHGPMSWDTWLAMLAVEGREYLEDSA